MKTVEPTQRVDQAHRDTARRRPLNREHRAEVGLPIAGMELPNQLSTPSIQAPVQMATTIQRQADATRAFGGSNVGNWQRASTMPRWQPSSQNPSPSLAVQAKPLQVRSAGDSYEQEADRIADQVASSVAARPGFRSRNKGGASDR